MRSEKREDKFNKEMGDWLGRWNQEVNHELHSVEKDDRNAKARS